MFHFNHGLMLSQACTKPAADTHCLRFRCYVAKNHPRGSIRGDVEGQFGSTYTVYVRYLSVNYP